MKNGLILVLLALISFEGNAQRIRITDTSNTWVLRCNGGGTEYFELIYTYKFKGDTSISGNRYQKLEATTQVIKQYLQMYPAAKTYYLREDTLAGMVWCRSNSDTAEHISYDASWKVGDTIRRRGYGSWHEEWYISAADSTLMAGQQYKVFKVKSTTNCDPKWCVNYLALIDGIGGTWGPGCFFETGIGGEYSIQLRCFYTNGSKPVLNPPITKLFDRGIDSSSFSNYKSCGPLAVNDDVTNSKGALLSPNPANESSRIIFPKPIQQGRLIIYNSCGQLLSSQVFTNRESVPLPRLHIVPGLYFYRIVDQGNGVVYQGRFVWENEL